MVAGGRIGKLQRNGEKKRTVRNKSGGRSLLFLSDNPDKPEPDNMLYRSRYFAVLRYLTSAYFPARNWLGYTVDQGLFGKAIEHTI